VPACGPRVRWRSLRLGLARDALEADADPALEFVRQVLHEFLREHRKVQNLEKQVEKLTTGLQKVSDELELRKLAPQMVDDNQ